MNVLASVVCPTCRVPSSSGDSTCRICGKRLPGSSSGLSARSIALLAILSPLALLICVVLGGYYYLNLELVRSEAFKNSLSIAPASSELQKIIGTDIHQSSRAFGHLEGIQGAEFAEWSVQVSGTRGRGNLYGIANRVNGAWDYARLVFQSDDGKERVDLTPLHLLSVPKVPARKVYLVPVELAESLDWAPSYYNSTLGIEVTVLPRLALDVNLIDPRRNQLDAEKCTDEFLIHQYPELTRDPAAMIIAVTSKDIYIPSLGWRYAENMRSEGRFAVVSSARLHPLGFLEKHNPEWLNSRLQKLLTKNIAMLYFGLPMSSDYTSLLSGGVLTGREIDRMGGQIIGQERQWDPFIERGAPAVTIYDVGDKPPLWVRTWSRRALPDTAAQVFSVSLDVGLLVQHKADFVFPDEPAMHFIRVYRNQDDRSRAFGVGGSDEFDMFLGGRMGVAVDLIMADGHRTHFVHKGIVSGELGDVYEPDSRDRERFTKAIFSADTWQVKATDGSTYFFPYRPDALPQYVTVLTGFIDPKGHKYEMKRDSFGSLVEVISPLGTWLHFQNDSEHRIRRITSSTGRTVQYDYDKGSLIRAAASDGSVDHYSYDDKGQLLTAAHGTAEPVLTNHYFVDGYIKRQTMSNGQSFEYHYFRDGGRIQENQITDPNGLETYVLYGQGGYREWLPSSLPR